MSVHIEWIGVDAFRQALQRLTPVLMDEARVIVDGHADLAATNIKAAYEARGPGGASLAKRVRVERDDTQGGIRAVVRNSHPIAFLYDHGSAARYHNGRPTGSMPAAHVFVPRAILARRLMFDHLRDMLRREGLLVEDVSYDPAA